MEVGTKPCGYAVELKDMEYIKGCDITRLKDKTRESMMACGPACYGGDHKTCPYKLMRIK